MKLIIAGSRSITPTTYELEVIVEHFGIEPTLVICGGAKGVDIAGEIYAHKNNIPVKLFEPDWDDIDHPDAVVKVNSRGKKYNAVAGHWRNQRMADAADALLLIWDGKSTGSKDMKRRAKAAGLKIFEIIPPS